MGNSNRRMRKRVEEFDYVILHDLEDHLERSSSRYQQICEELEELREGFTSRYSALQQEKFDMMEHLTLCLAQKEEQLSELMESLASLQQEFQENQKFVFKYRVLCDRLPETTRLVLLENADLKSQYIQVLEKYNPLLEENLTLQAQKEELHVAVNDLERFIIQVTGKSQSYHKVAEELMENFKLQAEEHQKYQLLQKELTGLLADADARRYQQKSDELEVKDFTSRYNALQQDTFDMMEHLKLCLAQQEEQLSELMESLASLQQEFQENQKLAFENRVLADSKLPGQETSSLSGPSAPADLAPQRAGSPAGHLSSGNAATRQ